jgi:signal transduction histidine kinase
MAAPMLTREDRAWGALVTIGASACFAPSAAHVLEQAAQKVACLLPAGWKAHAVAHDSSHERQMPADIPPDFAIDALIHELRAPLSAAGFALERLRSLMATEEDVQRKHLMTVATTGIAEAHNVMRWFHHQRSAQLQPDSRCPLSVEEAISTAMTLLAGNSLQLNVLIPGDFPLVMADFIGLTHIFTNLLDNAIHHTCPPHQVTIQGWQQQGMAHIAVTSNGSGIPYEQQQTIFQPYGGHQPTGQRNGHGMGLAVAQYLAIQMGGYIRVESDGETFTTFTLTLPACESGTTSQSQEEE